MKRLIVFSATWCKQCQPHKDRLKSLGFEFESYDAEEDPDGLVTKFNIKSLPTTVVLVDNVLQWAHSGTMDESKIEELRNILK